jgi:hypothetical protein
MESIKKLNENISKLSAVLEEYDIQFSKEPDNFSIKLTIDNFKSQIEDLQGQLRHENLKREKEKEIMDEKRDITPIGKIKRTVFSFDDRTNCDIENEIEEEFLGRIFIGFLILVAAGLVIAAWIWM